MTRVAWRRWGAAVDGLRPFCEAPRHRGQRIAAGYVMALVDQPDMPNVVQPMCSVCMDEIASDLGTTAAAGAVVMPPDPQGDGG